MDTLGLIRAMIVHAANIQDRDGARLVLGQLKGRFPRLKLIWTNGGYRGQLIDWAKTFGGWVLKVVKRNELHRFVVLPKRWIVERTFGWLGRYRLLSKDHEQQPESSTAMIHIAMINVMIHRLVPG